MRRRWIIYATIYIICLFRVIHWLFFVATNAETDNQADKVQL